jgi:OTU domain-containing protein 6
VAAQLKLVQQAPSYSALPVNASSVSFVEIREVAASQMRAYPDKYAPFLGLEGESDDYLDYCRKVESVTAAEWGGHVEVSAICSQLQVTVWIYEADKPTVRMGEEFHTAPPLRIAYHRHYYSLGEHYNSIEPRAVR